MPFVRMSDDPDSRSPRETVAALQAMAATVSAVALAAIAVVQTRRR